MTAKIAKNLEGTGPPPPQTRERHRDTRGDRTRRAILAAARARFAERGFEDTTLADVAAAAGVAGPTVAFHFGSKHGLLAAVIGDYYDELLSRIDALLDTPSSPAERLRAFAHFWLGEHDGAFDLYNVFASQGGWRTTLSESGLALRDNNRRITRRFERLVDDLRTDGSLRADAPTRLIRDAFFGTAEHVLRGQLHAGRPLDHERAAEEILALVLDGARARTAPRGREVDRLTAIDRKLDLLLERPPHPGES